MLFLGGFLLFFQFVTGDDVPEYPPRSLEPKGDPRNWQVAEVQDWVESIGFFEYRDAFAEGTVDGKKLMKLTPRLMEDDLILMAPDHRTIIDIELKELLKRKGLPFDPAPEADTTPAKSASGWSVVQVGKWLIESGYGDYHLSFMEQEVNGEVLLSLQSSDLKEEFGVKNFVHRKGLLEAIKALKAKEAKKDEL